MIESQHHFLLMLTTPRGILINKEVVRVTLPSEEGEITILAHHEPLIALARKGALEIEDIHGKKESVSIETGIIEVETGGALTLLLEDAALAVGVV